jgi:WhiB family transcriptional regulator, redox-sensing transcriptional regulator
MVGRGEHPPPPSRLRRSSYAVTADGPWGDEVTNRLMRVRPAVSWREWALCTGHPERDWWFPEDPNDDAAQAVAVCRACPVHAECLNFAITTGQSEGVWGGTTPSERRRLRQRWA